MNSWLEERKNDVFLNPQSRQAPRSDVASSPKVCILLYSYAGKGIYVKPCRSHVAIFVCRQSAISRNLASSFTCISLLWIFYFRNCASSTFVIPGALEVGSKGQSYDCFIIQHAYLWSTYSLSPPPSLPNPSFNFILQTDPLFQPYSVSISFP